MDNISPQEALKKLKSQIEANQISPVSSCDVPFTDKTRGSPMQGKSRIWVMLLYPDNDEHAKILDTVFDDFVCIGCLHDEDKNSQGEVVKPHYHLVFYFPSAVYASHILDVYRSLEPRFLYARKDIKVQVRYLLHLDSPSKFQYPKTKLEGHIERFSKYIDSEQLETEQVIKIIELIENIKPSNISDLLRLICDNGLYATYRRNAYTFNLILSQINNKVKEKNNEY